MSTDYRYPFNPDGVRPDGWVRDETHVLTPLNGDDYQFIVPESGPFFRKGLVVVHKSTGKILKDGKDFILTHLFRSAKNELDKYIYGSITFYDRNLSGELVIDYASLGGPYAAMDRPILNRLVSDITLHRTADWEDVVGVPPTFPSGYHKHENDDIIDMDDVVEAIEDVGKVISGVDQPLHRHPIAAIDELQKALDSKVSNVDYNHFLPISPYVVNDTLDVLVLTLPQVKVTTAIGVHLWITNGAKAQRIAITGILEPNKAEADHWSSINCFGENADIVGQIGGNYSLGGAPRIFLKSREGDYDNCSFILEKVTYTVKHKDNLIGDYGFEPGSYISGAIADIERFIVHSEYERIMKRLDRVKINTLLEETVFPVI